MSTGNNTVPVGAAATFSQIFDFANGVARSQFNGDPFFSRASGATTTVQSTNVNGYFGIYGNIDSGGTRYRGQFGDFVAATGALGHAATQEIDTYLAQKYASAGTSVTALSSVVVPANNLASGVSVQAYDLRTSTSSNTTATVLIDQVVDLRTAGESNDTVMVSGPDWVATGAGNDTVYLRDHNFRSIDGGQGYDSLRLGSGNTATSMVLADFVSNARGNGADAAANARVNAAGFRKLAGFEQLVLSESPAAQALTVAAADVNQLSDGNTLGVVLGSNDSITTTGFSSSTPTWGYYSFNGVVYDQQWTGTVSSQNVTLYARGTTPSFTAVAGATSGNNTLTGTSGNDLLQSGQGNDTVTGGAGADVFGFAFNEVGSDTVTDFSRTAGDKLDLSGILQGTGFNLLSNLSTFLQLSTDGSGNAVLKVDTFGESNFTSPAQTVVFSNAAASGLTGVTLSTLFDERVIMV